MNGVLPVDKPEGPTSHDIVAAARRALGVRRIGHTGTLDPFASGLLLLCIGPATRLAEYLTALSKEYDATVRFGEATDTDDHTGRVLRQSDAWKRLSEDEIARAFAALVGERDQLPPAYSAKKVDGKRLYAAARAGEVVERTPARVHIEEIEILRIALPDVDIRVRCGAGTYIRAIARDAGEALGAGGHLACLRRTSIGLHSVGRAVPLDQLADAARVAAAMLTPAAAVDHLPRITIGPEDETRLMHGNAIRYEGASVEGPVALCAASGELLGIGEAAANLIQPRKVFG